MRLVRLSIFLLVVALSIVSNIYYLKISWYYFTGIFLGLWLAYAFASNFIIKFYKNKKGIPQEKYSYAFPDKMANLMKKVDMRTQLESALLSMFFILVGMLALDIYVTFFMNFDWWFKGLMLFNSFWGFAFLLTSLVGQYQSYVTYMQTVEALNNFGDKGTLDLNPMKGGP
jgi:hypothetical protein